MRLLVTGASGFVGRHLFAALPRGVEWTGLSRRGCENSLAVDVLDACGLRSVVRRTRPHAVLHLAAIAQSRDDGELLHKVNVDGAVQVAEATWSEAPAARLVVVSTGYVHGETVNAADETAPLAPIGPYATSKADMERALGRLGGGRSLHIVRPFNHTGPGQSPDYAVAAFARKVAELDRLAPELEVGDLTAVRDLSDVRDLARILAWLCTTPEPPKRLNVCSGVGRPMGAVLEALLALSPVPRAAVGVVTRGRSALRRSVGDPALCRRVVPVVPRPWAETLADIWAEAQAKSLSTGSRTSRKPQLK